MGYAEAMERKRAGAEQQLLKPWRRFLTVVAEQAFQWLSQFLN